MIKLTNLTLGYGNRTLVRRANISIPAGRLVALIGRNGTGKSTLLRAMTGGEKPLEGKVEINSLDIATTKPAAMAKSVSLVTTERVNIANMSARTLASLGRSPYTDWSGRLNADDRRIVDQSLAIAGVESLADRDVSSLSDGEMQRVMVARALAQSTPVMLLDEPTSFLDLPNRYRICLLLRKLAHEQGKTILFSTHELDIALSIADDLLIIDTPHLVYASTDQARQSGVIERIFNAEGLRFDSATGRITRC